MNVGIVGSIAPGICYCVPSPPGPYPATGVVVSGVPTHFTSGVPNATVSSLVMYPCGSSVINSGSVMYFANGLPLAHTSSSVSGCGVGVLVGTAPMNLSM